jgi:RNA polymerase sigma factor (sigma-70 family)
VADETLSPVLRHIQHLAALRPSEGRSDGELLRAFLAEGDQAAFAAIVRRHGPLVMGVCRRVVRQEQDAEDACQATSLLLARRAASVRKQESLASWLHGVAYRMAADARRAASRRRKHEGRAGPPPAADPAWSAAWREVQVVLDEEVQRLPAIYREPFVLCCLENLSCAEAARRLGEKKGTVCSRLGRARGQLRRSLARRGIELTAVLAALALPGARSAARSPRWLASTVSAAAALAAGVPPTNLPASAQAVALLERVNRSMFLNQAKTATAVVVAAGILVLGVGAALVRAVDPEPPAKQPAVEPRPVDARPAEKPDAARLEGTWLFEAASESRGSRLPEVWTAKLTVRGDTFALSHFLELSRDLKGKFVLDPAAHPKAIDLRVQEYDLSASGPALKIPACTLPGIYRLDGDRLTVCFPVEGGGERPTAFATGGGMVLITLVKAGPGFPGFPKEVTVRAAGPDGRPAAGVTVARSMSRMQAQAEKGAKPEWEYTQSVRTGADGKATLKYEDLRFGPVVVRDPEGRRMAVVSASPASLQTGELNVTLEPECRVTGTVVCEDLTKAGKPVGWTNVLAKCGGRQVAMCDSFDGKFELLLPPGTYTLEAYGTDVKRKSLTVRVPAGRGELTLEPLALAATGLVLLQGRPAPELDGVVGWRGAKVNLADLRGKYVLLEFWGYWCGPCVQHMPVLIELHEKFADRGLVVVGVHLDAGGEVDTAAKLDEKIAGYREKMWQGKDLPFPVALTSGKRVAVGDERALGGAAGRYGVVHFPTTLLIDRDGKVVGEFQARDVKSAVEQVEKLLGKEK